VYTSLESDKAVLLWSLALSTYRCYLAIYKNTKVRLFSSSLTHSLLCSECSYSVSDYTKCGFLEGFVYCPQLTNLNVGHVEAGKF